MTKRDMTHLTGPILSDKTIWAPVDSAFEQIVRMNLESMNSEDIKRYWVIIFPLA